MIVLTKFLVSGGNEALIKCFQEIKDACDKYGCQYPEYIYSDLYVDPCSTVVGNVSLNFRLSLTSLSDCFLTSANLYIPFLAIKQVLSRGACAGEGL